MFGIGEAVGGIAQGAMNLLAAKKNFEYSKALNEQQFQHQQMLAKEQNDWNLAQWNRENEYNDYSSQVERMQKAGLNVGMMFGGNNVTTAPPLEASTPSVPSSASSNFLQAPDIMGSLNASLNRSLEQKKMELQERMLDKSLAREDRKLDIEDKAVTSQKDLNEILGRKADAETNWTKAQEDKVRKDIDVANKSIDVMDEQINTYRAQQDEYKALAEKARQEGNYIQYNAITQRMNAQSQRIVADATKEYYKQLGKQSESTVKLNEQNVRNLVSTLAKSDAETRLLKQQFEYNGQNYKVELQIKNKQMRILDLQAENQEIQNKLADATFYANVADAYIGTVDNAANCVTDCAGAFIDVSTAGATTVLKGRGAVKQQEAQTNLFNRTQNPSWSFQYGM